MGKLADIKVKNDGGAMYAPPPGPPPPAGSAIHVPHTNAVIEAGHVRARDEQQMQNLLQNAQFQARIYNTEIEPEHETDFYCNCATHQYMRAKINRLGVHDMWSKAVKYPGEKTYNDVYNRGAMLITSRNPYNLRVVSPYGPYGAYSSRQFLDPKYHQRSVEQTIALDRQFNAQAQASVDALEPKESIWQADLETSFARMSLPAGGFQDEKRSAGIGTGNGNGNGNVVAGQGQTKRFSGFKKSLGLLSTEEKAVVKSKKAMQSSVELRDTILREEAGRWPDPGWRAIVVAYQEKTGMTRKIGELRQHQPIQYLHLLRAGYFEPIPVAWATMAGNPLKFSIESSGGWRGITPAWRGYEDTAEERLYWVLNHREGSIGARLKPDFISEMTMARDRMATAVEPPPQYFSPQDTCHIQHTTNGYSKQVMPRPFRPFDAPETPSDDTMIMLDVSGSMDFDPLRPVYQQYLITGYAPSTQPKNKDVAKAIVRRFADAMAHHDHMNAGYDLVTFSSQASYIGRVNHRNLDAMWQNVKIGGGTRVMTGWQKVKDLHFKKHSESATWHPVYGWQAGPKTPMLRLLLLLDGEATDMDEFELDLLGLSWAHVTIFLIGVDGCPHHHRHANELTRISDVNHHVSFVDAQGNTPERFVTHELLKRHLGQDISMREFEEMEELPAYS